MAFGDAGGWTIYKEDPIPIFKQCLLDFMTRVRHDNNALIQDENFVESMDLTLSPINIIYAIDGITTKRPHVIPLEIGNLYQAENPDVFLSDNLRLK
jgi:hypothetical protein